MKILKFQLILLMLIFFAQCEVSEPDDVQADLQYDTINSSNIGIVYSFSFAENNVSYASTNKGFYKSTNNGDNWEKLLEDDFTPKEIMLTDEGHIYINYNGYRLFKSMDEGVSWTIDSLDFTNKQLHFSTMDKQGGLFMANEFSNYLYYSSAATQNWDSIYFDHKIKSLESLDNRVYVVASNDHKEYYLYVNNPDNNDFELLRTFEKFPNSFAKSSNSNDVFIVTVDQIFRMDQSDGSIMEINPPDSVEPSRGFSNIVVTDNNHLYLYREIYYPAEYYPSIVYKSEGINKPWVEVEPQGEYIYDMSLSPKGQLFISTFSQKIYRSNIID